MEDCVLKTWCLTGDIIENCLGHNDPILNAEVVHNGFITMQGAQVMGSMPLKDVLCPSFICFQVAIKLVFSLIPFCYDILSPHRFMDDESINLKQRPPNSRANVQQEAMFYLYVFRLLQMETEKKASGVLSSICGRLGCGQRPNMGRVESMVEL